MTSLDQIFTPEPLTWGLRGDVYVWQGMRERMAGVPLPATGDQVDALLREAFAEVAGVDVDEGPDRVYREELAHGGMSSGHVDVPTWRARLLPLLEERGRELVEAPSGP